MWYCKSYEKSSSRHFIWEKLSNTKVCVCVRHYYNFDLERAFTLSLWNGKRLPCDHKIKNKIIEGNVAFSSQLHTVGTSISIRYILLNIMENNRKRLRYTGVDQKTKENIFIARIGLHEKVKETVSVNVELFKNKNFFVICNQKFEFHVKCLETLLICNLTFTLFEIEYCTKCIRKTQFFFWIILVSLSFN